MSSSDQSLQNDISNVNRIPIVPMMLEVICRSTGMGFAAIARVTSDRWIACTVRDEIAFGMETGGELRVETTICNEIRQSGRPVIINNVSESPEFRQHHTPLMYGFQSYISVPIILKDGSFFGTLCAIDPKPADLNNTKTIGMFNLFAELISFHLHSMEVMEQNTATIQELNRDLSHSVDENDQYRTISNHNLQEPLRKIRIFSSMLVSAAEKQELEKVVTLAHKVNSNAQKFSMLIKDLSYLSDLRNSDLLFEPVDLNLIVQAVSRQLGPELNAKDAVLEVGTLPIVHAVPVQMEQLFFQLMHNAIRFARPGVPLRIRIAAAPVTTVDGNHAVVPPDGYGSTEIQFRDNGSGIERSRLSKVFNIFSRDEDNNMAPGTGIGLAYCKKIVALHNGLITVQSEHGMGTFFSIVLPIRQRSGLREPSAVIAR